MLPENDWRRRAKFFQEPILSEALALVERLKAVAARHGRLPGEVAIAWTLRHPAVTAAIVGARRPDQLDGVVGAADLTLTDNECTIDSITVDGSEDASAVADPSLLEVERGAIVAFDITNASSAIAGLAVRTIPVGVSIEDLAAEAPAGNGIPGSLQAILGITTAQLGARTGTAALVTGSPLVVNCIHGAPAASATNHFVMIVRPS